MEEIGMWIFGNEDIEFRFTRNEFVRGSAVKDTFAADAGGDVQYAYQGASGIPHKIVEYSVDPAQVPEMKENLEQVFEEGGRCSSSEALGGVGTKHYDWKITLPYKVEDDNWAGRKGAMEWGYNPPKEFNKVYEQLIDQGQQEMIEEHGIDPLNRPPGITERAYNKVADYLG
jgi:hypothetical protein